jgi:hypothetical protein
VTIRTEEFCYTVTISAEISTTLEELKNKAIKLIKAKYHKIVPKDIPLELEFEQAE